MGIVNNWFALLPVRTVIEAWDNENEADADDNVEEGVGVIRGPTNVVPENPLELGDDTNEPDDTGWEFLSIMATGEGDPELLFTDDE